MLGYCLFSTSFLRCLEVNGGGTKIRQLLVVSLVLLGESEERVECAGEDAEDSQRNHHRKNSAAVPVESAARFVRHIPVRDQAHGARDVRAPFQELPLAGGMHVPVLAVAV